VVVHKTGVNAAYGDGHAKWVPDSGNIIYGLISGRADPAYTAAWEWLDEGL
jgi:prepilin-type processing-associated H-X9-DG protein